MRMLILPTVLALPMTALAQNVSLSEYLESIVQNHPYFSQQALNSSVQEQALQGLAGDEDWVLTARPHYQHQQRSAGNSFIATEQNQFSLNAGLERQFWNNGARLNINYDYYSLDQKYAQPIGVFEEQGNAVSVTYSVPLMKNRGGELSRLAYELQAYKIEWSEVFSFEQREQFLQQQANLFVDWALLNEQMRIAKNRLSLAEEELQRTEKKRRSHLVSEVDVLRAQDAVINAKQAVHKVNSAWLAVRAELATQSGQSDYFQALPRYDLYLKHRLPATDESLSQLRQQSRLLQAIDLRLQQLQHQQNGLDQQLDPDLDLYVSGGLRSEDKEFIDAAQFNQPQYSVGVNFRYTFGQKAANADVSRARIERQQLSYERASLSLQLEAALRNVLIQLKELDGVMALNREQIEVAKQKTQAELKRHNQGRSELTFVIQSRDNEQNISLMYAENAASYQKLWLNYLALSDRLLTSALMLNRGGLL